MAFPQALAGVIARLADRQHGVVARRQLSDLGVSASTITNLAHRGYLHPLHRGVYAVGHTVLSRQARWLAAVLACPKDSVLSHGSAGQLLWLVDRSLDLAMHVTVPGKGGASPRGIVTHTTRSLDPRDITQRQGIPVTSVTRTVWDLASVSTPRETTRAFEQAERQRSFSRARLSELRRAAPSRKGASVIAGLLREAAIPLSETRSRLEEIALETCRDHGLSMPAVNVPLLGWEVDLLWERERFVAEADGGDHLSRAQRRRDNERDIALGRAGYLVRRYDWAALNDAGAVAVEIASILHERSRVDLG